MRNRHDPSVIRRSRQAADPPSLLGVLMLGLALFALILPIVGPLDDHHFAERSHGHGHIYLDGRPVAHQHAFDQGQQHRHGQSFTRNAPTITEPVEKGVSYFTDSAASFFLTVLAAPWNRAPEAMRPPSPTVKDTNLLSPYRAGLRHQPGLRVAPPVPPPITQTPV